jgi:PAS domain S-box-containing protein
VFEPHFSILGSATRRGANNGDDRYNFMSTHTPGESDPTAVKSRTRNAAREASDGQTEIRVHDRTMVLEGAILALRENEARLKESLKEVSDLKAALDEHAIVAITNAQGKITYVNDRFCRISKYSRAELIGQDHRVINSGHHSKEFIRGLWSTIGNGHVWQGEIKNKAKDGSFYWVDTTIVPFLNEDKKPRQYVAIRADITERKRAEEQLTVSLKEIGDLKAALDEHAIVAITDAQGKITFVNEKFCAISKYSREELLGQDHRIINSAHHPKEFIRDIWTTIARGKVWKGEIKNRAKDGTFYWVDTTIVPFLNTHGKPRQYVAIRADITERKRAEEVAGRMHAIEEANRIKSEFLANMSHELRTPLNGIIGFGEVLLGGRPGPLNPRQHEFLNDILNSGRHLLQLINDVLDLAKVEAGKMELNPQTFSVEKAVEEVCSVSRGIAHQKRIEIQTRFGPGLGDATLDQQKFKQVLYNLISNAVKFNREGGRVDVCADIVDDRLKVGVKDNGIGMSPADLPRLFREFEQLDSSTARLFGGTGLGLALTKKIVEFQKGTIGVESEFGVGSTFTVVLPKSTKE